MKINMKNTGLPAFAGARINIVANSDNHGNITSIPDFYNTIKVNEKDIFQKSNEPSTLNLYINAGDYFINGAKKGWRTHMDYTNMDVQADFFALLVNKIKKIANLKQFNKEVTEEKKKNKNFDENGYKAKNNANFAAIYTPGNHCYDAGDDILYKTLSNIKDLTVVMSNINPKAHALEPYKVDKANSTFVTQKEFTIDDDNPKYPFKKHHLLVLGATIPAMEFYNPGLVEKGTFVDDCDKKDAAMGKEDIKNTINALKSKVNDFKEKYPDGIIILASHMGTKLSKIVRDEIPEINEILDGHKHDLATSQKGNGYVSSLGQDNNIVKTISYQIGNKGEIERESYVFATAQYKIESGDTSALKRMLKGYGEYEKDENRKYYNEEVKSIVRIEDSKGQAVKFDYGQAIRFSNSRLANFLTTILKQSIIKKEGYGDIDAVGLQASIIRGGIANDASNFDLMQVFNGVSEKLSQVRVGEVPAELLAKAIIENIKGNLNSPDRNTIIHWSDIQVDRNSISIALENNSETEDKELIKFIKIRNKSGEFQEIDLNKTYKIAIADKYLSKIDIKMPQKLRPYFIQKDENNNEINSEITYHSLFMDYLNDPAHEIADNNTKCKDNQIIFDYLDVNNVWKRVYLDINSVNEKRILMSPEEEAKILQNGKRPKRNTKKISSNP